jgi:hypothetical protein
VSFPVGNSSPIMEIFTNHMAHPVQSYTPTSQRRSNPDKPARMSSAPIVVPKAQYTAAAMTWRSESHVPPKSFHQHPAPSQHMPAATTWSAQDQHLPNTVSQPTLYSYGSGITRPSEYALLQQHQRQQPNWNQEQWDPVSDYGQGP